MVNIELIKQLRDETGISIGECKKALEEGGSIEKAKEILKKWSRHPSRKGTHKRSNKPLKHVAT